MTQQYDIVIIGAGPGGYVAALKAGQMGASAAVVESGPLGGACLNVGCIPSKALLASAELIHRIRGAGAMGVDVAGEVGFNWAKIQSRKDKVIATLRGGIKSLFAGRNVTLLQGRGVLEGAGKVVVTDKAGAAQEIVGKNIIIATGSAPARIPGWPTDPEMVCTSDEALHWPALPKRLLIVGGGIIGCEFACMMQAYGVDVTVVEMMPRLLPELDGELAAAVLRIFTRRKIKCLTGTKVQELGGSAGAVKAVLTGGAAVEADKVLVAVGRRPATANLGLESVGLSTDRGFVRADDFLETPAKGCYSIGDVNGRCLLAHAASAQGVAAVENILRPEHRRPFAAPIPSCVYTFPELAAVGLSQEQARAKGIPVAIGNFPIGYLGKAMAVGDVEGFVKVIRRRESGELLGVHMMGHNVTECIAAAGALMHEKVTVREVAEVVFSHPTISESLKEAAEDALGAALHLPPRKKIRAKAE